MRNLTKCLTLALLSATAAFTGTTQATVIYNDFSVLGAQPSPGQINWNLNTAGGSALLSFELAGYRSLDGYNNGYTDIFHLLVNGTEMFTGSFNLGGGGSNTILYNPTSGSALTTTFGASDDVHNSHQVTWAGGLTEIVLPISLLAGANQLLFSYSGVKQGMGDESWGINLASIDLATTKMSIPEPSTFVLLMAGLLGIVVLRRKAV
jgi:hypothetical protein